MRSVLLPWVVASSALLSCLVAPAVLLGQKAHQQQQPNAGGTLAIKTHDDLQPDKLPPLPAGMTLEMIVAGDGIYHGKGNCFACHGSEAEGMPAAGDALTVSLNYAQYDWQSIDSLIDRGIPQVLTRSPIQMPPRGGKSNLTDDEVRRVSAYVWAISQTRGEPWPGGHVAHNLRRGKNIVTPTTIRTRADSTPIRRRRPR